MFLPSFSRLLIQNFQSFSAEQLVESGSHFAQHVALENRSMEEQRLARLGADVTKLKGFMLAIGSEYQRAKHVLFNVTACKPGGR